VGLTLFVNWVIKPFTMYAISIFFLGTLFLGFIGTDAVDYVKIPLGLDLPVGAAHGVGKVVLLHGTKILEVPLWRSYLAGCILLGIAPCTAMVLVWGYLSKGNDGHTLVMVAINSLTMLFLYGPLGGFLLGVGRLPVPWQALLLSIGIYVALPLVAGYFSRKWMIRAKGEHWFKEKFLHVLTPVTIVVDRDPALHPDQRHLLARLWSREGFAAHVRRRSSFCDDWRFQPLRGCHRHGGDDLRAGLRRCSGHGSWGTDRGTHHAPPGGDL
jgi:hypothetical protein